MDQLVRVIAKDAPVKAMAISGTALVERARQIHSTWPVATAALGRTSGTGPVTTEGQARPGLA